MGSFVMPQVTSTLDPANAVPVIVTPASFSTAFTMLSLATALIVGAAGASVLTTTVTGTEAGPVLPAESVCVALIDAAPTGLMSAPTNVAVQLPELSALTILNEVVPQAIVTTAFGSAVPDTTTPSSRSDLLTILSPAIDPVITGATGAPVSMVTLLLDTSVLILPALSTDCAVTVVEGVSAGIVDGPKLATHRPSALAMALSEKPPNVTVTSAPASA